MMKYMNHTLFGCMAVGLILGAGLGSADSAQAEVIEIATFNLKDNVSADEFRPIDKAIETQHVAKQPGFISRESVAGENGEWLVIVRWRSAADADASMAGFADAPATAPFMAKLDASSMQMKRYSATKQETSPQETPMQNKEKIQATLNTLYQDVFNGGKADLLPTLVDGPYIQHNPLFPQRCRTAHGLSAGSWKPALRSQAHGYRR